MTLAPYLDLTPMLQLHVVTAFVALLIGPLALWRRRRDRVHKVLGYVWVTGMAGAALSSFFIASHFSPIGLGPIHLLSAYGLWGIFVAMRAVYQRDIQQHKEVMKNVYVRGLALAGAFNLLPGRASQRALIPDHEWLGFVVIALVLVWAFLPLIASARRGNSRQSVSNGA